MPFIVPTSTVSSPMTVMTPLVPASSPTVSAGVALAMPGPRWEVYGHWRENPDDLETHLLLGQLYGLNHDTVKAEAQFKIAQKLDSNSEEVVLNMARLYGEQGDIQRASAVLEAVPEGDRSARVDFALASIYDQLHKPKLAARSYQAALDQDPDNIDSERGLAGALLLDNQLTPALAVLQKIVAAASPQGFRGEAVR